MLSLVGGGLLTLVGLAKRNPGGVLLSALGAGLLYRGATGNCPLYSQLGLSTAPRLASATSVPAGRGVKVTKTIHVNRPAAELYRFWRNLENLPRIMPHLRSIVVHGNRSHWVAVGPLGFMVHWDAEIINDIPSELIAWRSLPGSEVDNAGSVHFAAAPGGLGTRVTVSLKYNPPAGKVGAAVASVLGSDPEKQIDEDLRRFQRLMEGSDTPPSWGGLASGPRF